uniref:Uncharacterized protein n=1 Tax=Rhizophora mucronata TaxID=61149 RepID=A0A2P2NKM1_RHIMU
MIKASPTDRQLEREKERGPTNPMNVKTTSSAPMVQSLTYTFISQNITSFHPQ